MNKWLKIFLVILTFALISTFLYLILRACNITSISTLKEIINNSGKLGVLIYSIVLIVVLVCFCFVPLLNVSLTILGISLFGSQIAFISNMITVLFSTTILFFIGDKLGEKFARKLVGEKNLNDAQDMIDYKSKFWLPILFILPGIPDEAICLVAGMTKMKYWYLLLVSLAYHAFEIGIFCFIGSGLISWASLNIIDWFVLINVIIIDFILLFKLEKSMENKIKNKK